MSRRYIVFIIISVLFNVLFSCKSIVQIQEQALPQSVYFEDAALNIYVRDKDMIQKYASDFGIEIKAFVSVIQSIQVSITSDDSLAITVNSQLLSINRKREVMKLVEAVPITEDMSIWEYTDTNGDVWFFDISFKDALVISNIKTENIISLFTWEIPIEIQEVQKEEDTKAWIWNETESLFADLPIRGFSVHWFGMVVTDYHIENGATIDLMLYYTGNKSAKTTLKLLLPALLSPFGINIERKKSQFDFYENSFGEILMIRDIDIHVNTIDMYIR